MVYFIGHTIYNKRSGNWIALTNIPIDIIDLKDDISLRKVSLDNPSIHLLWQPSLNFMPLFPVIINTIFINNLKRYIKYYIKKKRKERNPIYFRNRECGLIK